ncbi:antirestriction protein (plasmid) [Guyparkeria sp. 1SP6A2]|nr:antirestriction protein [Guyparkeria sp. 1SP6A2]
MTYLTENTAAPLIRTEVPETCRLEILPRYAGRFFTALETAIYNTMGGICDDYTGGYWAMFELSNGGFYMAPTDEDDMAVSVTGNYFDGTMSADAAGIVACLFAFNALAWKTRAEHFVDLYFHLREFATVHPEGQKILRAID